MLLFITKCHIVYTNVCVCSGAVNTSAVTELVRFSNAILTLQFRMATSCNNDANGGGSTVVLEASDDDGATWQQVIKQIYTYLTYLIHLNLISRLYCHVIVLEILLA